MDGLLQIAALLATVGGAPADAQGAAVRVASAPYRAEYAFEAAASSGRRTRVSSAAQQASPDPWLSEDKFRHAAASWAAMVFTYAAVRTATDDSDVALGVALPVTAGFGIAKEVVDRRAGGPFSFRDLAADALGAGAAWLFLREVH